ncbi:MAG: hypothetical protein IPP94_14140 [Ignavibacteria bacterium]|nr:hypothetical protein [Ignavibacteria bacterium]
MRNLFFCCVFLLLTAASRGQSCTPPEDAGPHGAGWRSVTIQRGSRSLPCRVYYPALSAGQNTAIDTTDRPYPIVAFGHGFMAQNTYYLSTFEHLASRGYVTIAPQFPDTQHGQLAYDLLYCLEWLRTQHGTATSFLYGTLDTGAAAVSGHSMGGGASLLAASYDARVRVAAPLAPAETTPSAISAMPAIAGAVCLISGSADGITPPSSNQVPMVQCRLAVQEPAPAARRQSHAFHGHADRGLDRPERKPLASGSAAAVASIHDRGVRSLPEGRYLRLAFLLRFPVDRFARDHEYCNEEARAARLRADLAAARIVQRGRAPRVASGADAESPRHRVLHRAARRRHRVHRDLPADHLGRHRDHRA